MNMFCYSQLWIEVLYTSSRASDQKHLYIHNYTATKIPKLSTLHIIKTVGSLATGVGDYLHMCSAGAKLA